jgi:hypothetical protein
MISAYIMMVVAAFSVGFGIYGYFALKAEKKLSNKVNP